MTPLVVAAVVVVVLWVTRARQAMAAARLAYRATLHRFNLAAAVGAVGAVVVLAAMRAS